ncbi:MAG: hypothetical protein LQ340_001682 [Diploschistes diacapsis]|nr:MAG: hypothetical protein LQ340_001682 [Diploschistes diacapsis]
MARFSNPMTSNERGSSETKTKASETQLSNNPSRSDSSAQAPLKPAIIDVLLTRELILKASSHSLPIDLIDQILDDAEYWRHISGSKHNTIVARGNTDYADVLIIRTPPICALATFGCDRDSLGLPEPTRLHPARKIVFTIRSHDQGWSGEPPETKGTYRNSHTWFDAQIDKQFRPMPGEGDSISDVPWDLSSVRFLEAWPGHRHQVDEEEEIAQARGEGEVDANENPSASQDHAAAGKVAGASTESTAAVQNSEALNAGAAIVTSSTGISSPSAAVRDKEMTSPRLFSPAYLRTHPYQVQHNVQSRRQTKEHQIVWRWTDCSPPEGPEAEALESAGRGKATGDGRFVRELRLGDCVSLWGKARYPQWENRVEGAEVEIYFAL